MLVSYSMNVIYVYILVLLQGAEKKMKEIEKD